MENNNLNPMDSHCHLKPNVYHLIYEYNNINYFHLYLHKHCGHIVVNQDVKVRPNFPF